MQRKPLHSEVEPLAEKTLELYDAYVSRKLPGRFSRKRKQKCREMFVEELVSKMKSPTFFKKSMLVDCRSEEEFHVSSIKGAIHVSVLEERMYEDHREYAMEEMSELVEEIVCFDTVGMRSAHVALRLQDRAIYYPRIMNLRGGLLQWTHVGEDIFAPMLHAKLPIYHDEFSENDWQKTDRIHVAADCWKLQRPDLKAVTFDTNLGFASEDEDVFGRADRIGENDDGEDARLPFAQDRSCLWFPYTAVRDFWSIAPLNFHKGYINGKEGHWKRHREIIDADSFAPEMDGRDQE